MPRGIFKRTKAHRLAMSIAALKRPKRKLSSIHKYRIGLAGLGRKMSKQTREKLIKANSGENNYNWKGDKIKYRPLHLWVNRKLKKPSKCVFCGKDNLFKHKIHWANISGKYKRDLKDWIRLCVSCHRIWDFSKKRLKDAS